MHDVVDEAIANRRADGNCKKAFDETRTQFCQMRDERHAAVIVCACILRCFRMLLQRGRHH